MRSRDPHGTGQSIDVQLIHLTIDWQRSRSPYKPQPRQIKRAASGRLMSKNWVVCETNISLQLSSAGPAGRLEAATVQGDADG